MFQNIIVFNAITLPLVILLIQRSIHNNLEMIGLEKRKSSRLIPVLRMLFGIIAGFEKKPITISLRR